MTQNRKKKVVIANNSEIISQIKQYLLDGHAKKETAEKFGITIRTLDNILKKDENFNINKLDKLNKEEVMRQYSTFGIVKTARNIGTSTSKLKEYLSIEKIKAGRKSKNKVEKLESAVKFASLICRLITNMYERGNILSFRMPTENINLRDVDGELVVNIDTIFGKANDKIVFELGISSDWQGKFKTDIKKRMENERLYGTNFIFLTPQSTQKETRDKLIDEYKNKNFFNDIKIFDGVDITNWIEHDPATACWFNEQIGIDDSGIETLDMYYDKWLNSTIIPLDENLILAREFDGQNLIEKINNCNLLNIQSGSAEESLIFLISYLEKNRIFSIKYNSIIVNESALSRITKAFNGYKDTIIIPLVQTNQLNIENILFLASKGIKIILPTELPTEKLTKCNFDKIILNDIDKEGYIDYFSRHRCNLNIYDLFDATGYNLINVKKFLLKLETNEITNTFKEYHNFLLSILPIYKWQKDSLDENFIATFSNKHINDVEKILDKMSTKKLAMKQNEYRSILFVSDFLKEYNFTKYDIENILAKSREIIYNYKTDIYSNKTNSKYIVNGVFDTLRIIYNDNQNEDILRAKYLIKNFLTEVILDIFAQKIDFSSYLYMIAIIDPNLFLETIEYKLNNLEGKKEIYDFFAFNEETYFDSKRLYISLLSALEYLGKNKNYFLRVLKILFKIYDVTKNIDYKNIVNTPFNSIISIFANFYYYNVDSDRYCIDAIDEFFDINLDNVYDIIYKLVYDKISWNEYYYNLVSFNSIQLQEDKEFFKYCMGKCFESIKENQPKYWINLLHLFKCFDKKLYDSFIELLIENDFDNWTSEEKGNFKEEIKGYLDAYDNNYKSWFGRDYSEWDLKKLKKFYNDFKIGDFDDYIFYFRNINILNFDKDLSIKDDYIRKINDFIDQYGINKIIELLSKNTSKDYFYRSIIIKALIESKANFKDVVPILFNNNYYNELQQYLIGLLENNKNIFEEAYLLLNKNNLFIEKIIINLYCVNELKNFLEKYNLSDIYWKNTKIDRVCKEYLSIYIDNYKKYNNPYFTNLCINECTNIDDLDLILNTLTNMADYINKKYSNKNNSNNNFIIDEYYINIMLNKIYNNSKFYMDNFDKVLNIEISLYDFISNGSNKYQTPKTLELKIKNNPEYLLELMSFYYLPEGITEEEAKKIRDENKKYEAVYTKLFYIFRNLRFIPSMNWCSDILELYEKNGYKFSKLTIYFIIGQLLSNSPIDENDNIYPDKQARDIIEKYYLAAQDYENNINHLLCGFSIAKFNSRGVVSYTKGKAEKELSYKYKKYKEQLEKLYPGKYNYTKSVLEDLEGTYDKQSKAEENWDKFVL